LYWFLGDPEAAVRARDQGRAFAEAVGHPDSLAVGLVFASLLALDMRDLPALRRFVIRAGSTMPEDAGVQTEALSGLSMPTSVFSTVSRPTGSRPSKRSPTACTVSARMFTQIRAR
jgi:hypothetical protein